MQSFFAHCGFKLTMDSRTRGYDSGSHFKQGFHRTHRLIINKLLTVDLMVPWTPGSVVLIPAVNSNTLFHRKLRLFCSLWIKNNGPLDSSTHGFDPDHKFKHVISSNMPSFFAHCGFKIMVPWTPGSVVLIPAMNSNTLFHWKLGFFYALCGLKIMVRWTLGSKHLIPAINSNNDFIKYAVFYAHCGFNVTLDSRIRGFDPGHEFKHVISSETPSFLLTVDSK